MSIVKIYRWALPPEMHDGFKADWERITRDVAKGLGQDFATLFQMENGDFISVTRWPDQQSYGKWVQWIMASSEGVKYFRFEKERRDPVVVVL